MHKGSSDSNLNHSPTVEQNKCTNLENGELYAEMVEELSGDWEIVNSVERVCNTDSRNSEVLLDTDILEDEIDIYDNEEWDDFNVVEEQFSPTCQRGYKSEKRHALVLNKSKSGYKVLSFLVGQTTSDTKNRNFKNFNTISVYERKKANQTEENRCTKGPFPTYSTYCKAKIDSYALIIIKRMIDKERLLLRVNDVLSESAHAVSFQADCNQLYPKKALPKTCVIKVFKDHYDWSHKVSKENGKVWGQREVMGLKKLQGVVPCPQLISHKDHVVVMSFIGELYQPAPRLCDVQLEPKEYVALYKEITEAMRAMYRKGNLIHGSLSEHNILWHHRKCHFIDFHNSLEPHEEHAFSSLYSDCKRIRDFFINNDVPKLLKVDELFQYITGCSYKKRSTLMASALRKHDDKRKL